MEHRPYSKVELVKIIKRFAADKKRGISLENFCEMAGVDLRDFRKAFLQETINISEVMQIRVSKTIKSWENGEIAVYKNWDRTVTPEYRRFAKPAFKRNMGFVMTKDGVKLDIGIVNRRDYTKPTFLEHLEALPKKGPKW